MVQHLVEGGATSESAVLARCDNDEDTFVSANFHCWVPLFNHFIPECKCIILKFQLADCYCLKPVTSLRLRGKASTESTISLAPWGLLGVPATKMFWKHTGNSWDSNLDNTNRFCTSDICAVPISACMLAECPFLAY